MCCVPAKHRQHCDKCTMERDTLCRLCFTDGQQILVDIFSATGMQLGISDIISEHFKCQVNKMHANDIPFFPRKTPFERYNSILKQTRPPNQVTQDGTFPTHVCTKCWQATENFHQFYQSVKLAEEHFLLNQCKTEPDAIRDTVLVDPIHIPEPNETHFNAPSDTLADHITHTHSPNVRPSSSTGVRGASSSFRMHSTSPGGGRSTSSDNSDSDTALRPKMLHNRIQISPLRIDEENASALPEIRSLSTQIVDQFARSSDEEVVYVDRIETIKREAGKTNEAHRVSGNVMILCYLSTKNHRFVAPISGIISIR